MITPKRTSSSMGNGRTVIPGKRGDTGTMTTPGDIMQQKFAVGPQYAGVKAQENFPDNSKDSAKQNTL